MNGLKFGTVNRHQVEAMETAHEAKLLDAHLDYDNAPVETPAEAVAQAYLDEAWGGDTA